MSVNGRFAIRPVLKIVLPAPSIFTGAAVGMGITWEVVLAAEMISGGGTQGGGGLGFFIWNFMGGSLEQIGRYDFDRYSWLFIIKCNRSLGTL